MCDPKQNKMAGVNSRFATISDAEIWKIQEDSVPENSKKATKSVVEITWFVSICLLYTSDAADE